MQLGFELFYILETRKQRIHVYVWRCALLWYPWEVFKQVKANMW